MKVLITALGLTLASPLAAQTCFNDRDEVIQELWDRYFEGLQAVALSGPSGGVIEIFGNTETGTWTVLRTTPDGQTCLVDYGQGFSLRDGEPPVPGDDA